MKQAHSIIIYQSREHPLRTSHPGGGVTTMGTGWRRGQTGASSTCIVWCIFCI